MAWLLYNMTHCKYIVESKWGDTAGSQQYYTLCNYKPKEETMIQNKKSAILPIRVPFIVL